MGKYDPLTSFLKGSRAAEVPMTFEEIEQVIGQPLPASKQHPAWWSNNPANNVMTRAWLAAGYKSERVDVAHGRLVFRQECDAASSGLLERLWARLGGTVTVAPGVDLTEPTGEVWDAEIQ